MGKVKPIEITLQLKKQRNLMENKCIIRAHFKLKNSFHQYLVVKVVRVDGNSDNRCEIAGWE